MPHVSDQHDRHDPLLVVSLAAGDLAGTDRDRATSMITECAECALLHDDLLAIARATAALPAAASPRDFRISPEQAARLRPGGWRRLVTVLGAPRLSRPLGVGMATLGLAGLLLSALPPLQINLGSAAAGASMAAEQRQLTSFADGSVESEASSAAASQLDAALPGSMAGAPSPSGAYYTMQSDSASAAPSGGPVRAAASGKGGTTGIAAGPQATREVATPPTDQRLTAEVPASEGGGVSLLVVVSGIVLAIGIVLLIARRIAGASAVR